MVTRIFCLCIIFIPFFSCQTKEGDQPAKPAANQRFESLAPQATGVTFVNEISETHESNIITNSYLYNGGGVAILDVNNDGLPDIYFSATQGSNKLYLNKGNFEFEDITDRAGVGAVQGFKTGVTVVDINADGWDDLYVCRTGLKESPDRANLLFVNNQDGAFSEKAADYGLADLSASNHANFFDYDLDGDLDVYILNHPVDFSIVNNIQLEDLGGKQVRRKKPLTPYESDRLYRNEGNSRFSDVSEQAGIVNRAFGLSVTVTDFNQDGYPDIYVGNDYIEPDILYINNRNGTFTDRIGDYIRHMSNHTMGVDIADFNNDGLQDLVGLDMMAEDNRRRKLLMSTMVLERYKTLVQYGYGHQVMRNVLQLNTGEGQFSEVGGITGVAHTDWSWSPLLADFDNDGLKDLYITNGYRRDVTNLDYLTYTVDSINRLGGINARTYPDFNEFLKLIPSEPLQNYMYRNTGDLAFQKVSDAWGFLEKSFSNGSAWADLDADGDLDLVVNNISSPANIYKNRSRELENKNYLQVLLAGPASNPQGVGARLEIRAGGTLQVLEMTPTRGFFSSSEHLFHFGLGDQTTVDSLILIWPDGKAEIRTAVAANQRLTLSYSDAGQAAPKKSPAAKALFEKASQSGLNFVHQEDAFEDFDRERLLPNRLSTLGPSLAAGDVNGDGLTDLFVGGAAGQSGALCLQTKNGTFSSGNKQFLEADQASEDMGAALFDADGDGDLDLYVVSGGNSFPLDDPRYQDRLYLNDGKGNFTRAADALPALPASGSCVRAHDYDADGDLDLFVGGRVSPGFYPTPPNSYVLQNNGGKFAEVTNQVAPEFRQVGMVSDLHFADLNADGKAELLVAGEWMPIQVFSFENGKWTLATDRYGLEKSNGWWNCLATADLDGDGDLDILGGNLGLNTRLRASEAEPMRLYARDFDGNGSLDPIVTYVSQGKEYPLARREMLLKQLPGLKKKFVYFRPYAEATLFDVFTEAELKQAKQWTAYHFENAWFENNGGRFTLRALPRLAQLAPAFKTVLSDLNADGRPDIILAGNSYAPEVESGRYDAGNGLVLLNQGGGEFRPLHPVESGFRAARDAKDLAEITLANGRKIWVIANNNSALEVYYQ